MGVLGDWTGQEDKRLQQLLQSGCRTGRELSVLWGILQREAMQCAAYLGQDLEGHLAVAVEGIGEG